VKASPEVIYYICVWVCAHRCTYNW